MNRTKRIKNILENNFLDYVVNIIDNSYLHKGHNNFNGDGETHILIELKKRDKINIKRLEIHKKINLLLKNEFNTGLHSLQIKII
tara:strand:- start:254 stop:508 length:255 start_codon:yes stop_codon:yes gene_type:complete